MHQAIISTLPLKQKHIELRVATALRWLVWLKCLLLLRAYVNLNSEHYGQLMRNNIVSNIALRFTKFASFGVYLAVPSA